MAQQLSLITLLRQFVVAMLVLDTWQYFMHRYMHHNKFLYRHIHSQHHRLVVLYAFGALYNHPLEGMLLDTIGGALSFLLSGMSPRTSIFFFSFATIKTVDDHCGLWLPGNLFHVFFQNNSAYHDIHHQLYGSKYNFSQPFFVMWDKILGTHMPYSLEKRADGGLEARPAKDWKHNWWTESWGHYRLLLKMYSLEKRMDGGLEARPTKDCENNWWIKNLRVLLFVTQDVPLLFVLILLFFPKYFSMFPCSTFVNVLYL